MAIVLKQKFGESVYVKIYVVITLSYSTIKLSY